MYFENPFKKKENAYLLAVILCIVVLQGIIVGFPQSYITNLVAIFALASNMFITNRWLAGIPWIIYTILTIIFYFP